MHYKLELALTFRCCFFCTILSSSRQYSSSSSFCFFSRSASLTAAFRARASSAFEFTALNFFGIITDRRKYKKWMILQAEIFHSAKNLSKWLPVLGSRAKTTWPGLQKISKMAEEKVEMPDFSYLKRIVRDQLIDILESVRDSQNAAFAFLLVVWVFVLNFRN